MKSEQETLNRPPMSHYTPQIPREETGVVASVAAIVVLLLLFGGVVAGLGLLLRLFLWAAGF